jgi:hypothetical protein
MSVFISAVAAHVVGGLVLDLIHKIYMSAQSNKR